MRWENGAPEWKPDSAPLSHWKPANFGPPTSNLRSSFVSAQQSLCWLTIPFKSSHHEGGLHRCLCAEIFSLPLLHLLVRLVADLNRSRTELKPGTLLTREWDGHPQRVMVLPDGFSWNGTTYPSLSKVAFAITGTRWSGPRFFGLDQSSSEVRP